MAEFKVRVALGNGTREQEVKIVASNQEDARRMAEHQTGGVAKGAYQISSSDKKK